MPKISDDKKQSTILDKELEKIKKGEAIPYSWPEDAPFYKDSLAKSNITLQNLPISTRAILGMFSKHSRDKKWTYKDLICTALEEYLDNHKDEIV